MPLLCGCEGPECRNAALLAKLRAARQERNAGMTREEHIAITAEWLGITQAEVTLVAEAFERGELETAETMLNALIKKKV